MEGKEWGWGICKRNISGQRYYTVGNIGLQGSDINGYHDGVGKERGVEGLYDIEEMDDILDI